MQASRASVSQAPPGGVFPKVSLAKTGHMVKPSFRKQRIRIRILEERLPNVVALFVLFCCVFLSVTHTRLLVSGWVASYQLTT